jgi:hypothetical protein
MSCLLAPPTPNPELLARLHLHAVLPAFEDLVKNMPVAREWLGSRRFCLRLLVGQLSADLYFSNGRCRFSQALGINPQVVLRYLSYTQLNKQFSGRGFSLPIPVKGARQVGHMRTFSRLAAMLQEGLLTKTGLIAFGASESQAREVHLRLTFSVALAACVILIQREAYAKTLFAGSGDWTVQLMVLGARMDAWIARRAGVCSWGRGKAHSAVTARLVFDKPSTALKALSGSLDNFSAINAGELCVHGLAPLVDKLGLVFERVPFYLQPK